MIEKEKHKLGTVGILAPATYPRGHASSILQTIPYSCHLERNQITEEKNTHRTIPETESSARLRNSHLK